MFPSPGGRKDAEVFPGTGDGLGPAARTVSLSVSVPVAVAAWVVGCDEDEGETQPPVQPPVAVGSMPELTVVVDSTERPGRRRAQLLGLVLQRRSGDRRHLG